MASHGSCFCFGNRLFSSSKGKSIALIGAGQQASSHLAALQSVRAIEKVFIYDRTAERARKLIAKQQHNYPECTFIGCSSVQEAVQEAEIICTLTSSQDAFLEEKTFCRMPISMQLVHSRRLPEN